MKICFVSSESRAGKGGLAAYMRLLVRRLQHDGHVVTTISRFDREFPGQDGYAAGGSGRGSVIDGVTATLVGPSQVSRPLLSRLNHLTGRPGLRRLAPRLFHLGFRRSLRSAIPTDTDIVHYVGTGWELLGFAALYEARRRAAAFTVWPAVHPGSWGDSPLDTSLYRTTDAVFCQSDHELEHLARLGVPRQRLVRAWLAPATDPAGDAARFRERYNLGSRRIILFIARKSRSKGFHALCAAMPAVLEAIPDACLVAVGPEGERPYPAVRHDAYLDLGPAADTEKADALAACDVFCMPSSAESFGIVYTEAWSFGKPVVGGPSPAVRELIQDGVNGFCVSQEPSEIARVLVRLLVDGSLAERLGAAGQALQRDKYTWDRVLRLHLDTFDRVRNRASSREKSGEQSLVEVARPNEHPTFGGT